MIIPFGTVSPTIGERLFLAPNAWVIGACEIGEDVSIFFGSVLRGDILPIRVGKRTNIQEHSIIHTSNGRIPTTIGEEVTVGHRSLLHGCTVGNRVLIGMGSTLLDECVIGDDSVIGAGSLVTERKVFPPRSMIFGSPARVVRELRPEEIEYLRVSAERYVQVGRQYREQGIGKVEAAAGQK